MSQAPKEEASEEVREQSPFEALLKGCNDEIKEAVAKLPPHVVQQIYDTVSSKTKRAMRVLSFECEVVRQWSALKKEHNLEGRTPRVRDLTWKGEQE